MTTALVTGSHLRGRQDFVFASLDAAHERIRFTHVVTGGADYIDTFAMLWCMDRKVSFTVQYADWRRHNNLAGPIRNQVMLDKYNPTCIIAFDGDSGTLDMKRRARERGITVHEIIGS